MCLWKQAWLRSAADLSTSVLLQAQDLSVATSDALTQGSCLSGTGIIIIFLPKKFIFKQV